MKGYASLLVLSLLFGCSSVDELGIRVRFDNQTGHSLTNFSFISYQEEIFISEIPADNITDFTSVAVAFPRGYLRVEVNGQEVELFPVAYTDESPLPSGDYTYRVRLLNSQPSSLSLDLMEK